MREGRKEKYMFRSVLYGLISCFLLGAQFAYGQEKQTIRWLTWEQVPNFITSGRFKGQGIGDALTAILQRNLPQYNHSNVISNTRRYNRLIQEPDVCVAWAWIVPGSRDYRIHSRPISLAPRTGIQTLKSKQKLFGKPGETLSLAKLLANPSIKLGYLEEMAYSKDVHTLLEQYDGKNNIHLSSTNAVEFNLNLLDRNRVDYFFGFSAQAIFEAELKGIPNQYQFYNIEEIDTYTSMHTHCSKNAFGEKVMAEVERIIDDELLLNHLARVERWYGENTEYRDSFLNYVIKQNPSDRVSDPGL